MQATSNSELNMPDLMELDLLQLLNQEPTDMIALKKLAGDFVHLLVNLFESDLEQAIRAQDVKEALIILSERLNELTCDDHSELRREVD
jgi:hypothetical protein